MKLFEIETFNFIKEIYLDKNGEKVLEEDTPTFMVKYSPDGKYILSDNNINNIDVWDSETGKFVKELEFREDSSFSYEVKFTPDNNFLIAPNSYGFIEYIICVMYLILVQ